MGANEEEGGEDGGKEGQVHAEIYRRRRAGGGRCSSLFVGKALGPRLSRRGECRPCLEGGREGGGEGGKGGNEEQDQATFFHLSLLVSSSPSISASVVPLNPVSFTAVSRSRR